jgi:hypothetical protein
MYPFGSRSQSSQWFGPPLPSGGLRWRGSTTSTLIASARAAGRNGESEPRNGDGLSARSRRGSVRRVAERGGRVARTTIFKTRSNSAKMIHLVEDGSSETPDFSPGVAGPTVGTAPGCALGPSLLCAVLPDAPYRFRGSWPAWPHGNTNPRGLSRMNKTTEANKLKPAGMPVQIILTGSLAVRDTLPRAMAARRAIHHHRIQLARLRSCVCRTIKLSDRHPCPSVAS